MPWVRYFALKCNLLFDGLAELYVHRLGYKASDVLEITHN